MILIELKTVTEGTINILNSSFLYEVSFPKRSSKG